MIHYYRFKKGFGPELLTDKLLESALMFLKNNKNPFIHEIWIRKFRENANRIGYALGHPVFDMRLEGDLS